MTKALQNARSDYDLALAPCLLAVDPSGVGGIVLRSSHGPAVELFVKRVRRLLPGDAPFRRMPLQVADGRLLGGLDLAMTLQAGRPVFERGLLADADGGCLVVPMAERLPFAMALRLCSVLDQKEVAVERDGFACRNASRIAVIALDEGASDDERPPAALVDRLAIHLIPDRRHVHDGEPAFDAEEIARAKAHLPRVTVDDAILRAFCHAAQAIGISSLRAPMLALKVARIHAALCERDRVGDDDAVAASRLVLAPRATVLPSTEDTPAEEASDTADQENPPDAAPVDGETGEDSSSTPTDVALEDIILAATQAAIPANVLARLQAAGAVRKSHAMSGGAGAQQKSAQRGRPAGAQRGELKAGVRLNIVETLRAAAPWQKIRQRKSGGGSVEVRPDDFRITRFKRRGASATIFVVDASGSSALHRLAEAKGAIELLLADCYVRRDQVALIAFRGKSAELILPPTRSLARAKRSLTALPGGGGTPVAAALDSATGLADGLRRKGLAPTVVMLTDGRANISRDGKPGREQAELDALASAQRLRASKLAALVIDISPRSHGSAERLATNMGACYLPLPNADARRLSQAVQVAVAQGKTP
jgi:magnesium chelatase subunit D